MTRNEFPSVVATILNKHGLPVSECQASLIAFDLWDAAQAGAESGEQFREAITGGLVVMVGTLKGLEAGA